MNQLPGSSLLVEQQCDGHRGSGWMTAGFLGQLTEKHLVRSTPGLDHATGSELPLPGVPMNPGGPAAQQHPFSAGRDRLDAQRANAAIKGFILHGVEAIGAFDEIDRRPTAPVAMHTEHMLDPTIEVGRTLRLQSDPTSLDFIGVDLWNERLVNHRTHWWSAKQNRSWCGHRNVFR